MAKGFKMRRPTLKLGHNGQIKPINTRFAGDGYGTPILQDDDILWSGGEVIDSGNQNILRVQRSRSGEGGTFTGANYDKLPQTNEDFVNPAIPGQTWPEWVNAECGSPGKPWGTDTCPEDQKPSPGVDEKENLDVTGSIENPSFNVLTPHLRRRNARMRQGAGKQDQKAINAANRRVRNALRRGKEPMGQDIEVLSGIGLGSWEGFDPNQMTSGNVSLMGYRTPRYSGEGGSTDLTQGQMNTQLQAILAANPDMKPWEAAGILQEQLAGGGGIGSANYTGMHIDDRTARLMKKKGYDIDTYGIDPRALEISKTRNPNRLDQGGEGTAVGNLL